MHPFVIPEIRPLLTCQRDPGDHRLYPCQAPSFCAGTKTFGGFSGIALYKFQGSLACGVLLYHNLHQCSLRGVREVAKFHKLIGPNFVFYLQGHCVVKRPGCGHGSKLFNPALKFIRVNILKTYKSCQKMLRLTPVQPQPCYPTPKHMYRLDHLRTVPGKLLSCCCWHLCLCAVLSRVLIMPRWRPQSTTCLHIRPARSDVTACLTCWLEAAVMFAENVSLRFAAVAKFGMCVLTKPPRSQALFVDLSWLAQALKVKSVKAINLLGTRKSTAIVDYVVLKWSWHHCNHRDMTNKLMMGQLLVKSHLMATSFTMYHAHPDVVAGSLSCASLPSKPMSVIVIQEPNHLGPRTFLSHLDLFRWGSLWFVVQIRVYAIHTLLVTSSQNLYTEMLHGLMLDRSNLLIVGDFNVHVNDTGDAEARRFLGLPHILQHGAACHLPRNMCMVTHWTCWFRDPRNHCEQCQLSLPRYLGPWWHCCVWLTAAEASTAQENMSSRHFKGTDLKALKEDLSDSAVMGSFFESAEDSLAIYRDTFTELLDKHGKRWLPSGPNTEWYIDEIR